MQTNATRPISENELYLKLFITNGGGWQPPSLRALLTQIVTDAGHGIEHFRP